MRAIPAAFAALFVAIVLSACGPRDRALAPSDFSIDGLIVPAGTQIPPGVDGGLKHDFYGLYAEPGDAAVCCWIGERAVVFVKKSAGAKTFVAGIYVPTYPLFAGGQDLALSFGGDKRVYRVHLHQEQQAVRVPLPASLWPVSGTLPVHVTARVVYVPERDTPSHFSWRRLLGRAPSAPGDDRRLGAVLLYAFYD